MKRPTVVILMFIIQLIILWRLSSKIDSLANLPPVFILPTSNALLEITTTTSTPTPIPTPPPKESKFCTQKVKVVGGGECKVIKITNKTFPSLKRKCTAPFAQGKFTGYHICTYPSEQDTHISNFMLIGHVPKLERVIYTIAERFLLKQGPGVVIDIGSNVGLFSYLGLSTKHTVISVDPVPTHVEMIRQSVILNGVFDDIIILQNAVSSHCGTATLQPGPSKNPGGTSIAKGEGGNVQLITMDQILSFVPRRKPIYLLKIDAEGQEPWIFEGASNLWSDARRPSMIIVEFFNTRVIKEGCSLEKMLRQFVLVLNYKLRVFPRMDLIWDSNQVIESEEKLVSFIKVINDKSEMDVIFIKK